MPTKPDTAALSHYLAETLLGWKPYTRTHSFTGEPQQYAVVGNLERRVGDLTTTGDGFLLIVTAMRERHLYAEIEVEPDLFRVSYYKPYFAGPVHWGLVGQAEHERLPEANAEAAVAALEKEESK